MSNEQNIIERPINENVGLLQLCSHCCVFLLNVVSCQESGEGEVAQVAVISTLCLGGSVITRGQSETNKQISGMVCVNCLGASQGRARRTKTAGTSESVLQHTQVFFKELANNTTSSGPQIDFSRNKDNVVY